MYRILQLLAISALTSVLSFASATAAERRVALVIGNSAYKSVPILANPTSDAKAIADALKAAGFSSVLLSLDLDRAGMVRQIQEFQAQADGADWAVVYFAGHGLQVDGTNYLVPVDAALRSDRDVDDEALTLDRILLALSGAREIRLVILDACRSNPFQPRLMKAGARFSGGRGLARVDPEAATMIAFAARDGQVARDGDVHSPFVEALLQRLPTPGLEIGQLFRQVRDDVLARTEGQQEPFVYGSLPGRDFFFVSALKSVASIKAAAFTAAPDTAATEQPPPLPKPRRFATVLAQAALKTGATADLSRVLYEEAVGDIGRKQVLKATFGGRRTSSKLALALVTNDELAGRGFDLPPATQQDVVRELARAGCRADSDLTSRTLASLRAFSGCVGRTVIADPASQDDLAYMRGLKSNICSAACAPQPQPQPRSQRLRHPTCTTHGSPACVVTAKSAKFKIRRAPVFSDDQFLGDVPPPGPEPVDWMPGIGSERGRGPATTGSTGGGPVGSQGGGSPVGGVGGSSKPSTVGGPVGQVSRPQSPVGGPSGGLGFGGPSGGTSGGPSGGTGGSQGGSKK
jgi:hypothetical protein